MCRCYLAGYFIFINGVPVTYLVWIVSLLVGDDVYFGDGLMPIGMGYKRLRCNDAAMKG